MNRRFFLKSLVIGAASLSGTAHIAREIFAEPKTSEQESIAPVVENYPINNLALSNDGKEMFIRGEDEVYRYELSTPWDLSTSTYAPILIA